MKKRIVAIALTLAMLVSLCACGGDTTNGGGSKEATYGGEVTVGILADLDASLDPHVSSMSAGTREILFNIFEGLVKPDTEGNLVPALAESYEVNDTADVYTFKLRSGVKFHNGNEVTARDVLYSLTRAAGLDTGTPLVSDLAGISKVESPDDETIVVTLSAGDTEFASHMTAAIVPDGSDPGTDMIGTGPYKYVSRSPGESVTLEKNTEYWGEEPYVDTFTLKVIEDSNAMVNALKGGSVDMATHMEAGAIGELETAGLTIFEGTSNIVQALYLNNAVAPFDDVRVRQAISYAIDKEAVINLACDGYGTALGSSMFPAFKKYFVDDLTTYYTKDIEKAKALLTDAGYPDGFTFTITVASNMTTHVRTAEVLVEQLKEIGVTAKINQVEWATWLSDTYQGKNFEGTVVGFDAHGLAASDMLARFQSTSSKNFLSFSNTEYDETYAKAISTVDEEEQTKLFKRCEEILTEQAASAYIQDPAAFVAAQEYIGGYTFYPLYVVDLTKVYRTDQESK